LLPTLINVNLQKLTQIGKNSVWNSRCVSYRLSKKATRLRKAIAYRAGSLQTRAKKKPLRIVPVFSGPCQTWDCVSCFQIRRYLRLSRAPFAKTPYICET
jgi:hypothetical protein